LNWNFCSLSLFNKFYYVCQKCITSNFCGFNI